MVLEEIFGQSKEEGERAALHAHLNRDAICGIYRQHAEAQCAASFRHRA
jgi:ATP-dependent Clp protease adapter protein ClpS